MRILEQDSLELCFTLWLCLIDVSVLPETIGCESWMRQNSQSAFDSDPLLRGNQAIHPSIQQYPSINPETL